MSLVPRLRTGLEFAALVSLFSSPLEAFPNVSLDDPRYDQLASLYARDLIDSYLGGLRPLTEARMNELVGGAGESPK